MELGGVLDQADLLQHVVLQSREQQLRPEQLPRHERADEADVLLARVRRGAIGVAAVGGCGGGLELKAHEPQHVRQIRLQRRQCVRREELLLRQHFRERARCDAVLLLSNCAAKVVQYALERMDGGALRHRMRCDAPLAQSRSTVATARVAHSGIARSERGRERDRGTQVKAQARKDEGRTSSACAAGDGSARRVARRRHSCSASWRAAA